MTRTRPTLPSFLLPLLSSLWLATGAHGELTLSAARAIANPGGPVKVVAADIFRKGVPDLVVANSTKNSISIHPAIGGGKYGAPVDYPAGVKPVDIVVHDVDNDGVADLIVLDGGGSISVLKGKPGGTFNAAKSYPVGDYPTFFDVTARGPKHITEIVTANTGSQSISYLRSDGAGGFEPAVNIQVGREPPKFVLADLDGDGMPEYVVPSTGDGTLTVISRDPTGKPVATKVYAAGIRPSDIVTGDINGDGFADIAVIDPAASQMLVFFGNGDGTLQPAVHIAVGTGSQALLIGNLDGDRRADLVVCLRSGDYQVFLGSDLTTGRTYRGGGPATGRGARLSDYDGDGIADLIAVSADRSMVGVLSGARDGTFGAPQTFDAGSKPGNGWALLDLDGDGTLDLAIPNTDAGTITLMFRAPTPPAAKTGSDRSAGSPPAVPQPPKP